MDSRGAFPTVVIVGAGFGGLWAARALRKARVQVVLIDRNNHHVFQPLLYQVATAALSPADIAQPIRSILRGQGNLEVLMAEVVGVNLGSNCVQLKRPGASGADPTQELPFDYLILAPGSRHSHFGHDEWEPNAPGLKTLDDATAMRSRILLAFEQAESEPDPAERAGWLTFVVVGGGPTGVELAGSLSEIAFRSLGREFSNVQPENAKVLLIEAGERLLPHFPPDLSAATQRSLERMGVEVRTGVKVEDVSEREVKTSQGVVPTRTVLWAAGNVASPLTRMLEAPVDRTGRVLVNPDCSAPGHPKVFVIGDAMCLNDEAGAPLPGVAQVAMQQGDYVAQTIASEVAGTSPAGKRKPFHYVDKGIMATIGRRQAVCVIGGRKFKGPIAWMLWLTIHIWYLIGFRNRLLVLLNWAWMYVTFQRPARLITGRRR
ncbi:MAG: NAD(P)/FAD-dependent oxidoreductase [Armatimonadetes bacterium]|nr:NAD(P)/FAD-dependent oxidoreductase [Armatimonadota bacterium]